MNLVGRRASRGLSGFLIVPLGQIVVNGCPIAARRRTVELTRLRCSPIAGGVRRVHAPRRPVGHRAAAAVCGTPPRTGQLRRRPRRALAAAGAVRARPGWHRQDHPAAGVPRPGTGGRPHRGAGRRPRRRPVTGGLRNGRPGRRRQTDPTANRSRSCRPAPCCSSTATSSSPRSTAGYATTSSPG